MGVFPRHSELSGFAEQNCNQAPGQWLALGTRGESGTSALQTKALTSRKPSRHARQVHQFLNLRPCCYWALGFWGWRLVCSRRASLQAWIFGRGAVRTFSIRHGQI